MASTKPVALITGASSGMGAGFTRDLVQKGWNVAMVDLKASPDVQADVGDAATFYTGDVSDYDSQAKCFQAAWDTYGRLDLVCLNAGIIDRSPLYILQHRNSSDIPPAPDLKCTDVNVKGVYYGTQLAIHFMRKNVVPGGSIVVTASASSLYPHECYPEYSGSKAAVWNFVRASARVLRIKDNIRINCIRPGFVPTSLAPPGMIKAAEDIITPLETIVKALNKILDDKTLSGAALECSMDKILLTPEPEFLNGEASARASFLWEPGFVAMHGEASQLPEAAP
ncbi:hypothetical protein Sste5346_002043 [Sporothrix stenoceras]|uniref:15-hydroxyprostaglandin dehydrogenase n=1 Tax=Sporothrix stenoceras TaxID=5173 RepID=A0ABR3ZKM6_9PEZI